MTIRFQCPECRKTLASQQPVAGRQITCPSCGAKFAPANPQSSQPAAAPPNVQPARPVQPAAPRIQPVQPVAQPAAPNVQAARPAQPASPSAQPARTASAPPPIPAMGGAAAPAVPAVQWRLLTAAGEQFGPLSPEELATWVREGRVAADSQVYCDGWTSWKWASDAFPQLQGGAASQPNPYDFAAGGGLAPAAAPHGGARKSPAAAGGAGWHDVKTGLQISMASLMVGACGLLLLLIAILSLSSGQQDVSAAKLMANMMIWGGVSLIGSFFSMLTGFLVCWGIPRRSPSRGMAVSAAVTLCVSVGLLVVVAPGMLTLMGGNSTAGEMQGLANAMKWLILVTNSAAMILHAFFAAGVAREFGDRGCGSLAIGFTVLEAASFLWFVYLELGDGPKSPGALKSMMALTFLLAIASRVYLAVIAQRARSRVVRGLRSA